MHNEKTPEESERLVPYEKSLEVARQLMWQYEDELREAGSSPRTFDEGVSTFTHDAISHFLENLPPEVLEEFEAHGISKGAEIDRLAAFINILENRSIKGSTGMLVASQKALYSAYLKSPFLILSHFKKPLGVREDGKAVTNQIGLVIDPGAYVVNNDYYPIVDELKNMFPGTTIIRANELPAYIAKESKNDPDRGVISIE